MWSTTVNAKIPDFTQNGVFTLGGLSDSIYEYFPKQYLLLGGSMPQYRKLYVDFIDAAKKHMFFRPLTESNLDILFSGNVHVHTVGSPHLDPKGQHLGCFVGGMVGLGALIFDRPADLTTAIQLTDGCVWAYNSTATGIMPEIFHLVPCEGRTAAECKWSDAAWHTALKSKAIDTPLHSAKEIAEYVASQRLTPGVASITDRRYLLRPEAIESIFVMYRITGDRAWQDKAWRMFEAVEAVTRTPIASSAIQDVTVEPSDVLTDDRMESFWLAETLKYFYLVFAEPNVVSLDEFV
jgi:mannosyl-oligosaccharide alpha-1,2-mannosidase